MDVHPNPCTTIETVIGAIIMRMRKAISLSQTQLALNLGITQGALARIEKGKISLSFCRFTQICAQLNLSPEYMISLYTRDVDVLESKGITVMPHQKVHWAHPYLEGESLCKELVE